MEAQHSTPNATGSLWLEIYYPLQIYSYLSFIMHDSMDSKFYSYIDF
jgi:hypothetical protein